jgi:hypothetical protein
MEEVMEKLREYLVEALAGFERDPPDSNYQEGYQAALEELAREFFLEPPDAPAC